MANKILVRRAGTSWAAVLGGWIASIGAMAVVAPAIGALLANVHGDPSDVAPASPVILGLFIAYLVGGYVAGRMAGYRTSWHGMMTAFLGLLVIFVLMLAAYAADQGFFAASGIRTFADIVPGVRDLDLYAFGNALTFGALMGFLASIFAGWLGGVLAPSRSVWAAGSVERREVVRKAA